MDEAERRLQVSLRLKAARFLAGHVGKKGATQMLVAELRQLDAIADERMTQNRLEEIEQMTADAKRSELDAIIAALGLPDDWFGGLYLSDRGEGVSDSLGAVLLELAADARSRRQGPEAIDEESDEGNRPPRAEEGGA